MKHHIQIEDRTEGPDRTVRYYVCTKRIERDMYRSVKGAPSQTDTHKAPTRISSTQFKDVVIRIRRMSTRLSSEFIYVWVGLREHEVRHVFIRDSATHFSSVMETTAPVNFVL